MPLITNGPIFSKLKEKLGNWAQPTDDCVTGTVTELLAKETSDDRPGMLLGQIQSGKTRAFVGAIALAFDNGFELAIVLTKGTKALAKQTQARLVGDLKIAFDEELVLVYDIRLLPETLTEWQLARKLVIVCKKEDDNLERLQDALTDTYEELSQKKALIVDDEADFTSVGYRRTPQGPIAAVIPTQIDVLRHSMADASFLQVTATPYSLYLQPENVEIPATGAIFKPVRPAFTKVVPVHAGYIGGRYYFEDSQIQGSVPSFLRVDVSPAELDVLKREDRARFKIEECLTSNAIEGLRRSIIAFVVGAWIRRGHPRPANVARPRYAFIVHTHTTRVAHDWQALVVRTLLSRFRAAAETDIHSIRPLVEQAHSDLSQSLVAGGLSVPTLDGVLAALPEELRAVAITTVNSNHDINMLLDETTGQLRLDNPYNVFIGGNILDRGLTIDNLIGFYYGRNPRTAQQDTVLQHSRMYGNRPLEDMAVSRFYSTPANYNRMRTIYEFDAALRAAFEQGTQEGEVVILRNDPVRTIIPCAPNKLLISDIIALRPGRRLIPKGFSTNLNTETATSQIDHLLNPYMQGQDRRVFHLPLDVATQVIELLATGLQADPDGVWDSNAFKASMRYLASQNPDESKRQEVVCLSTTGRNDRKRRQDGRLQDAPESSGDDAQLDPQRGDRPALLLYRENGSIGRGWTDQAFYWPVLQAPPSTLPVIFASKTLD